MVAQKKEKPNLLPAMGDLSIYLFVADLYAAGLLTLPTPEDLGVMIAALNSGAIKGLKALGYLPADFRLIVTTRPAVIAAFQEFYQDVEQMLTAEERENMPWNPIVAEHSLCKLTRMQNARCYC